MTSATRFSACAAPVRRMAIATVVSSLGRWKQACGMNSRGLESFLGNPPAVPPARRSGIIGPRMTNVRPEAGMAPIGPLPQSEPGAANFGDREYVVQRARRTHCSYAGGGVSLLHGDGYRALGDRQLRLEEGGSGRQL